MVKYLAFRGYQDGFIASLDAALRTARMAVGGGFRGALLCGAAGIGDVSAQFSGHSRHGKRRRQT